MGDPVDLPTPATDLDLIRDAAVEAGNIAMQYFRRAHLQVSFKENDSPVSEADHAVDQFLHTTLLGARPGYGWLSEEIDDHDPQARIAAPRTFIVDPIDGTRAFIAGKDRWCVSIGVAQAGRPIAGVLYCPALKLTFVAAEGQGAFRNGTGLSVAPLGEKALVGGRGSWVSELGKAYTDSRVEPASYVPSLAYRIAMVATGELGGTFVRPSSHDWDLAAADIIAREAGVELVSADGSAPSYNGTLVTKSALVCAHPALIGPMLHVVTGRRIG
ncbi:MAG: 3'(2'),5'-bisphosphate nucleotidase CysQ [Pseudomonadota bacterium]